METELPTNRRHETVKPGTSWLSANDVGEVEGALVKYGNGLNCDIVAQMLIMLGGITPGSSYLLGGCPHGQRGHAHVHHRGIPASLVDGRTSDAGNKAARVGKSKECRRTKSGVDGARDDVGGDVLHVRVPKLRLPEYSCGGPYVSQESRGTP